MGYKHVNAVLPLTLPSSQKHLLLVMAHYANATTGLIYPSVGTLGKVTALSERQVQRNLRALELAGIVKLIGTPKGRTRRYQICLETVKCLIASNGGDKVPVNNVAPGVTSAAASGDSGDTLEGKEGELKGDLRKGCSVSTIGKIKWPKVYCVDGIFSIPPRYDHNEDFAEAFREWFRERVSARGADSIRVGHLVTQFSLLDALPFEEALDQVIKAASYGTNRLVFESPDWMSSHLVGE